MAALYDDAFCNLPIDLPPHAPLTDMHAWHLYVIRLHENLPFSRDQFIELMAERGISCSVHFIPLHLQPYWRASYQLNPDDFPESGRLYRGAVSLPLYTRMKDTDQLRVIEAVIDIFNG
jgi:dTDP-4-amino-4,6-dideoxygalactose transaminase